MNAHPETCACTYCVDALLFAVAKKVPIDRQIEIVVGIMIDLDLNELLPVLHTLQFVRNNQKEIRKVVKNGKPATP